MFQYAAPSSLCADAYKQIFGGTLEAVSPVKDFTFSIQHPTNNKTWKRSGNVIRLNNGEDMQLATYNKDGAYRPNAGYVALLDKGNKASALNLVESMNSATLAPLANKAHFGWFLMYDDGASPGYFILSAFDNKYLGYDPNNDTIIAVPKSDSKVVRWKLSQTSNIKSQLKAVAFMNYAQGTYKGEPGSVNVNACVFPSETLDSLRIEPDSCSFLDKEVGATLYPTKGGMLDSDRNIAESQVKKGKGVFPSGGCATSTVDFDSKSSNFYDVVKGMAEVIDRENIKTMNAIRKSVSEKFKRSESLQAQIQKQTKDRDQAQKDYVDYLLKCKNAQKGIQKQTADLTDLKAECKQRMLINNASRANYCLDMGYTSKEENAQAVCNSCDNRPSQHWRMDKMGRIKSKFSGKCLGPLNGGSGGLTPVVQTTCSDTAPHQRWFRDSVMGTLKPSHAPNMCLYVGGNGGEGENVYIDPCDANPAKRWTDNPSLKLVPNPAPPLPPPVVAIQQAAVAAQQQQLAPPPPPPPPQPRGKVQLFSDCWYEGTKVELGAGNYRYASDMRMPDNSLSSMKIPPGYKVTLFKDASFQSVSQDFTEDVPCLADLRMDSKKMWNDNASSMKIVDLL